MLDFNEGTDLLDYSKVQYWTISLDIENPENSIKIKGNNLSFNKENGLALNLFYPFIKHEILTLRNGKIEIKSFPGNKIPIFLRIKNNILLVSNAAHLIMEKGEEIVLNSFVVAQQLRGVDYPQKNIFNDIMLLEPSSLYEIDSLEIKYKLNLLEPIQDVKPSDVFDILLNNFEDVYKEGKPITVLLSGGYDSRLNLAISLYFSEKYGNKVDTFHEYKNDEEFNISKKVAELANVPFRFDTRTTYIDRHHELIFNKDFIKMHSGVYRDNLIRWHYHLANIKKQNPETTIIGFGAEPHKGKYYNQIDNFHSDPEKIFGIGISVIKRIVKYLNIKDFREDCQNEYFDNLKKRVSEYNSKYSKIDFLHYNTYVSNGYGLRSYDMIECFSIPFPFTEHNFLKSVFSMDGNDKIGFKIVTGLIQRLNPELLNIDFTSANENSLYRITKKQRIVRFLKEQIKKRYRPQLAHIGWRDLPHPIKEKFLKIGKPKSAITIRLYEMIIENCKNTPGVRLEYVLELFLYLNTLENEFSVTFITQ